MTAEEVLKALASIRAPRTQDEYDLHGLTAQALQEALAGEAGVKEIRGQGLMLGVELDRPCGALALRALEAGLLISVTAGNVVRLLPPLIMREDEAREVARILAPLIINFLHEAE